MMDGRPARIVTYGPPAGVSKLELRTGVLVDLPFAAEWVTARVSRSAVGVASLIGVGSTGNVVARYDAPPATDVETELRIEGTDIVRVQVSAKRTEGGLIEICAGARAEPAEDGPKTRRRPMADPRSLEEVRAVLERNRESLTRDYDAVGTGIGKADVSSDRYVITVYLRSAEVLPAERVSLEGVDVSFVVTGEIVPLGDGEE
jgi:hypothetical protein